MLTNGGVARIMQFEGVGGININYYVRFKHYYFFFFQGFLPNALIKPIVEKP